MSIPISLMRGNYYLDCNSRINTSTITNTNIYMKNDGSGVLDMGGAVIHNAGTPSIISPNLTDVVNVQFLQQYIGQATSNVYQLVLSGTIWSVPTSLSLTSGSLFINIRALNIDGSAGGPSATFSVSKSTSSITGNPTRITSCGGLNTGEKLMVRWLSNSNIQFQKTGSNYDGTYEVQFTLL
jgi:hypothetical protein